MIDASFPKFYDLLMFAGNPFKTSLITLSSQRKKDLSLPLLVIPYDDNFRSNIKEGNQDLDSVHCLCVNDLT